MIFVYVLLGVLITTVAVGLALGVVMILSSEACQHSYERIDTCNDKKMVFVCRKCGKIKKLSK